MTAVITVAFDHFSSKKLFFVSGMSSAKVGSSLKSNLTDKLIGDEIGTMTYQQTLFS